MKVAFSTWEGRISPVFDTSRHLLVLDMQDEKPISKIYEPLQDEMPWMKIARLRDLGINILICGAISRPLADLIARSGIRLIPFVAGDIEDVIRAFLSGGFPNPAFLMPGYCGRGRYIPAGRHGKRGRWQT